MLRIIAQLRAGRVAAVMALPGQVKDPLPRCACTGRSSGAPGCRQQWPCHATDLHFATTRDTTSAAETDGHIRNAGARCATLAAKHAAPTDRVGRPADQQLSNRTDRTNRPSVSSALRTPTFCATCTSTHQPGFAPTPSCTSTDASASLASFS